MRDGQKTYEADFFRWINNFLRDNGYKLSKCGFKNRDSLRNHEIDFSKGFWKNASYSLSKPIRWLYHIIPDEDGWVAVDPASAVHAIGFNNPGQKNDKTAIVFRVQPLVQKETGDYIWESNLEVNIFFLFHGPPARGTSAQTYSFNPATGVLNLNDTPLRYIAAGFLGLRPRGEETDLRSTSKENAVNADADTITYGEVLDALCADVKASFGDKPPEEMPVFDLSEKTELERIKRVVADAWDEAGPVAPRTDAGRITTDDDDEIIAPASLQVPEIPDLIGVDTGVYRQINAALASGKRHIMLYGPPGTGKTTLARHIASVLTGGKWTLVTGSSDWSSQDIIGGYQPVGEGSVAFVPGVLLRHFDRPLIIDELNRCDIDKVLGPLFTVLSGQQTTLPYRLRIGDEDSPQFTILPNPKSSVEVHEFAPGLHWRLVATINSIDKAALYQMSYALARRFGWVYVDVPRDATEFVKEYLRRDNPDAACPSADASCPIADFWEAINTIRALGPAPVVDAIRAVRVMIEMPNFFTVPDKEMKNALLDAIDMVLLPMLDGILLQDAEFLTQKAIEIFRLDSADSARIDARMKSVAV